MTDRISNKQATNAKRQPARAIALQSQCTIGAELQVQIYATWFHHALEKRYGRIAVHFVDEEMSPSLKVPPQIVLPRSIRFPLSPRSLLNSGQICASFLYLAESSVSNIIRHEVENTQSCRDQYTEWQADNFQSKTMEETDMRAMKNITNTF